MVAKLCNQIFGVDACTQETLGSLIILPPEICCFVSLKVSSLSLTLTRHRFG